MLRFRAASALLPAHALIVLVGALLSWAVAANTASPSCVPFAATETARVEAVVDGDTLRLADGRRVRLIGVNAPELHDRSGHAEPGAVSARRFASRFLGGSRIMLVVGEVRHIVERHRIEARCRRAVEECAEVRPDVAEDLAALAFRRRR